MDTMIRETIFLVTHPFSLFKIIQNSRSGKMAVAKKNKKDPRKLERFWNGIKRRLKKEKNLKNDN